MGRHHRKEEKSRLKKWMTAGHGLAPVAGGLLHLIAVVLDLNS